MILKEIKYSFFSLPLKKVFRNSFDSFSKREGFIIKAVDEQNNVTYGEASPLPNFSRESLKELEEELKLISQNEVALSNNLNDARKQIKNLSSLNSLRFAFEQILLNFLFLRKSQQNNFLSKKNFKNEISINAVLDISEPELIMNEIQKKYFQGYRTFKIKIGRENFEDDLALLEKIQNMFGNKIKKRLDVNGKWDYERARNYLKELEKFEIEFIEEPCSGLMCNLELAEKSKLKIALDESLKNFDEAKKIIESSQIDFVVVKPMIYGSLFDSVELINYAEAKNKYVIISSSFESAVGKSALVFIASCSSHLFAHGLDTSDFFERDICYDYYAVNNGRINFDIENFPPKYDLKL